LLSYLLLTFSSLVKHCGSPKVKLIPTCPAKVCYSGGTFLYIPLMDFFGRIGKRHVALCRCFMFHVQCTETTGWFAKGQLIPTCPLTKCYSR
jgi:hypothetical protein